MKNNIFRMMGGLVIVLALVIVFVAFKDEEPQKIVLKKEVYLTPDARELIDARLGKNLEIESKFTSETNLVETTNIYFNIASDYTLLGEYALAREYYEKILAIDPKNANVMSSYSALLAAIGDKVGALDVINKAVELLPDGTYLWRWKLALEKERNSRLSNMRSLYETAILKTRGDIDMVTDYASFLGERGQREEAIRQWQRAIEIYPEMKNVYEEEIAALSQGS